MGISAGFKIIVTFCFFLVWSCLAIKSISFSKVQGVTISGNTIDFTNIITGAVSISTKNSYNLQTLQRDQQLNFSVALPVKPVRTAIGFTFGADREERYLTPDYVPHAN